MKKVCHIISCFCVFALTLFTSCQKNGDNEQYFAALVTVKPNADNTAVYLQLDDKTVLYPVNISKSPFGTEEVRALTSYRKANANEKKSDITGEQVYVNWLNSILTKPTAENLGQAPNMKAYGTDPVEIVNDWVTIAEDGYLTLRFRTYWGGVSTHTVNMVYDGDETNPYHVSFYHSANGDFQGRLGDGIVAFRLSELPDTQGETVDLTMEWNSFSGWKKTVFKYCSRDGLNTNSNIADGDLETELLQ